jgi:uncharacterized membrane protein YphA (DoxX/SURF4 family)
MDTITNTFAAMLMIRLIAGILFFFQGYDKLFNVKVGNIVNTVSASLTYNSSLRSFLKPVVAISSGVEMIGGILLALGIFRDITLYALAGDLVFVALAFSSFKAMWDMGFYFPRLVLIAALLLLPAAYDAWTIDALMK